MILHGKWRASGTAERARTASPHASSYSTTSPCTGETVATPPPPLVTCTEYPRGWEARRVKSNGDIRWRGQTRFIAKALAGESIGLQKTHGGIWRVYFGPWLMGELRERERGGMRPVVYQTKRAKPKVSPRP